jgi:hypothetical protein
MRKKKKKIKKNFYLFMAMQAFRGLPRIIQKNGLNFGNEETVSKDLDVKNLLS